MGVKEERIRAITKLYYSNPAVQAEMIEFATNREAVPRYMKEDGDTFGRRPDILQYASDIQELVKKGATSFHVSEELWHDPLSLNSDMTQDEMNDLRKGWDLLIDIDSKYLDISKILAKLVVEELEKHGVKNYGIKFSGSKGFHIIVGDKAFPKEYNGVNKKEAFPVWPRAICEYLTYGTRAKYNEIVTQLFPSDEKTEDEKSTEALCPSCSRPTKKGSLVVLECPLCRTTIQRKDMKETKKKLKCVQEGCTGFLEKKEERNYFVCSYCDISSISKMQTSGRYSATFTEHAKKSEYAGDIQLTKSGNYFGASDMVLVAPRHLFRMPYSLHEKTALASVVLTKDELEGFSPKDADPLKVNLRKYLPQNEVGEAKRLLAEALAWKKERIEQEQIIEEKKYANVGGVKPTASFEFKDVTDDLFPQAIKKLMLGLEDGRKRGLFVLLTFLRSMNFSAEEIYKRTKEWNEKNKPPLKEGYVRSQIDWHLKQKKKIMPPNYANEAFYRDIGLIDKMPDTKNPLVDVMRNIKAKGKPNFNKS